MNSNPMRTKVSRTSTEPIDLDRLTSLPDPIITHILSFLSTKYAARTSVLSTKWKYFFLSVPKIILDDPELLTPEVKEGRKASENLDFIEFVNRRLMLSQTSSITEFRLKCQKLPAPSVSRLWLRTLIFRNLDVLEIEEPLSSALRPPSELFVSRTLGVLKLRGPNIVLKINPQSVHFPKLKVLHLKDLNMQFDSEKILFAEGYPVIEDLWLERIRFGNSKHDLRTFNPVPSFNLNIFLSTLLNLAIAYQRHFSQIDIDTPNLQHLTLDHCHILDRIKFYASVKLCSCDFIESVGLYEHGLPFVAALCRGDLTELLNHVNNVKELRISREFLKIFDAFPYKPLPQFPKLTKLELTANGKTIWKLLQRAPILKALVYDMDGMGNCWLPGTVPVCFGNNLREIKIKSFNGSEAECAAVRYLMQHAKVLEKMTIELIKGRGIQQLPSSALKQLIEQKPHSPTCRIEIQESCS